MARVFSTKFESKTLDKFPGRQNCLVNQLMQSELRQIATLQSGIIFLFVFDKKFMGLEKKSSKKHFFLKSSFFFKLKATSQSENSASASNAPLRFSYFLLKTNIIRFKSV